MDFKPMDGKPTPMEACAHTAAQLQFLADRFRTAAMAHLTDFSTLQAEQADGQAHVDLEAFIRGYAPLFDIPVPTEEEIEGPDEYLSIWTVIDGVLEDEAEIADGDSELVEDYLETARERSKPSERGSPGRVVEVFSIYHPHPSNQGECQCAQYEESHKPIARFEHGEEA